MSDIFCPDCSPELVPGPGILKGTPLHQTMYMAFYNRKSYISGVIDMEPGKWAYRMALSRRGPNNTLQGCMCTLHPRTLMVEVVGGPIKIKAVGADPLSKVK
jgi:hypothetical protein